MIFFNEQIQDCVVQRCIRDVLHSSYLLDSWRERIIDHSVSACWLLSEVYTLHPSGNIIHNKSQFVADRFNSTEILALINVAQGSCLRHRKKDKMNVPVKS